MIYYCADEYGLCSEVSQKISECVEQGCLNKISCFPNFDTVSSAQFEKYPNVSFGLHLNLVEGNALSDPKDIPLLAHTNGKFRHTFLGLLQCSLMQKTKLEGELYRELKAQILFWQQKFPQETAIVLDSHQHTHMIPLVFRVLMRIIREEDLKISYLRIPAEPVRAYLMTPSIYLTYSPINLVKQWLLKILWQKNKKEFYQYNIPTAYFMGILFSGKMDEKRVQKVLPHYIRLAKKTGRNIEVLFHPGGVDAKTAENLKGTLSFLDFYLSPGRQVEYQTVKNLKNT